MVRAADVLLTAGLLWRTLFSPERRASAQVIVSIRWLPLAGPSPENLPLEASYLATLIAVSAGRWAARQTGTAQLCPRPQSSPSAKWPHPRLRSLSKANPPSLSLSLLVHSMGLSLTQDPPTPPCSCTNGRRTRRMTPVSSASTACVTWKVRATGAEFGILGTGPWIPLRLPLWGTSTGAHSEMQRATSFVGHSALSAPPRFGNCFFSEADGCAISGWPAPVGQAGLAALAFRSR